MADKTVEYAKVLKFGGGGDGSSVGWEDNIALNAISTIFSRKPLHDES
jgi:hypothetical protein